MTDLQRLLDMAVRWDAGTALKARAIIDGHLRELHDLTDKVNAFLADNPPVTADACLVCGLQANEWLRGDSCMACYTDRARKATLIKTACACLACALDARIKRHRELDPPMTAPHSGVPGHEGSRDECPTCHGEVGHRVNCPRGIAVSTIDVPDSP